MSSSPLLPAPSAPSIAALVVTHQRLAQLQVTVARLLAEPLDRVLVFDNGSTDGTGAWLAGLDDPRLQVITNAENLGGAGGFARGMRHLAEGMDPDWLVVMDDDGRPVPGAIARFRAAVAAGLDWDAVGAAVLTPKGGVCEMNRPYRNPFWHGAEFLRTLTGGRRGFHLTDAAYAEDAPPVAVDMSSFVGLFVSRAAIARAGYPDERLFIYGDDQLYTLQMRRKGLGIGFLPQIRFEHDTGSIQSGRLVLRPMWKVYYMYRNALIAYRVAAGPWFWPLLPVLAVKWRGHAGRYGADGPRYRRILRRAFRDGLTRSLGRPHREIKALSGEPVAGE